MEVVHRFEEENTENREAGLDLGLREGGLSYWTVHHYTGVAVLWYLAFARHVYKAAK